MGLAGARLTKLNKKKKIHGFRFYILDSDFRHWNMGGNA